MQLVPRPHAPRPSCLDSIIVPDHLKQPTVDSALSIYLSGPDLVNHDTKPKKQRQQRVLPSTDHSAPRHCFDDGRSFSHVTNSYSRFSYLLLE